MALGNATYLGIDLGTSDLKAVLVDASQRLLASATIPIPTSRPHPGWSEQAPEDWWRAACLAIEHVRAGADLGRLRAIGLSGQMHGLVLLDEADVVLRPAILWNDSRAGKEASEITKANPNFGQISGAAQSPSFWPAKLLWLRRHEPEVVARTRRLLAPKDYIRLKLTGLYQTDPCDAAGTLLFDEASRDWSAGILAACSVTRAQLPAVVEGDARAGPVLDGVAEACSLPKGVVVAGGGGDAACGAISIGAVGEGEAYISLGTSAQIFVSTAAYRPAVSSGVQAFAHALPDMWFQAAAVLNGASALAWVARLLGHDDPSAMLAAAEAQYAGPGRLLFLPYLTGGRTPHNDPHARGVLFGLSPEMGASAVVQAVIEGVAYSLADALECLKKAGARVEQASLVGGGGRSAFWTRIIADTLGIPIVRHADAETGSAFGAARLARLAVTDEAVAAVCTRPAILDRTLPDLARHQLYAGELARYRALYQAVQPLFPRD